MSIRPTVTRCAALVCVFLTACEHAPPISNERRVATSEEVANVFVSAYPAVPWTAISDKLEPKHELTTAEARALAATTTQSQVNQFLSTFAAGLAIGLPSRTQSSVTTIAADGSSSTTGSRKIDPGSVPSSSLPGSAASISDASLVGDISKGGPVLGIDASTQLTVGTAVYQLAQILDNQISKSIAPKGYQAHLLTFQVNLQPRVRNLPYDAYVNLTLMPASWGKAIAMSESLKSSSDELAPIIVYPLIIADAMESSSVAKSVETIRQAAFALSGIVGNAGVNLGLSGGSDNLGALLGSDRNSLVTVGRISDHTLRIRLGAQLQGTSVLALTPRTHNISVVVFTRSGDDEFHHLDKLAAITGTTFVDTASGVPLPSARSSDEGRETLKLQVDSIIRDYGYQLSTDCRKDGQSSLDLLRALDRGDYGYVSNCLSTGPQQNPPAIRVSTPAFNLPSPAQPVAAASTSAALPAAPASAPVRLLELARRPNQGETKQSLDPAEESRLRRVVAQLMTAQTDSRFSKLLVQLTPFKSRTVIPPRSTQLALINDDASSARVVLREGENLEAAKLRSTLLVTTGKNKLELLPVATEVDAEGRVLTLVFPSLIANKLLASEPPAKGVKTTEGNSPTIKLQLDHVDADAKAAFKVVSADGYTVALLRPDPKPAGNPVSTSSAVLVAGEDGSARLTLVVGEWNAKKQGGLVVRVSGADIRSIEPARAFDAKVRGIPVSGSSVLSLVLGNLTAGRLVQISTLANNEAVGSAIALGVEPTRAKSR